MQFACSLLDDPATSVAVDSRTPLEKLRAMKVFERVEWIEARNAYELGADMHAHLDKRRLFWEGVRQAAKIVQAKEHTEHTEEFSCLHIVTLYV